MQAPCLDTVSEEANHDGGKMVRQRRARIGKTRCGHRRRSRVAPEPYAELQKIVGETSTAACVMDLVAFLHYPHPSRSYMLGRENTAILAPSRYERARHDSLSVVAYCIHESHMMGVMTRH